MAHLIAVEGFDGMGKSTLIKQLAKILRDQSYDFTVVKSYPGTWIPEDVMADVVMGFLPNHIAADLRLHRYLLQMDAIIKPYIMANVNVLSDRGPASTIWRLRQLKRDDLASRVLDTLKEFSMHLVLRCDAETCWERIAKTRPPSRIETNFITYGSQIKKEAFIQAHDCYYELVENILKKKPVAYLNGENSVDDIVSQALEAIGPIMERDKNASDIPYYDGLAAEVQTARSFRSKNNTRNLQDVRDGTELMRREWLQGISQNKIHDVKNFVIELTRCPQAHVRETALNVLNKFDLTLKYKDLLNLMNDPDKDVRAEASIMSTRLSLEQINKMICALSLKPGAPLEALVEAMQATQAQDAHQDLIMSLIDQFPYLRQAVARGCKRQPKLCTNLIAALLVDDKARTNFIKNLGDDALIMPTFEELRQACQCQIADDAWATIIALQATAASQNPRGLLDHGSLLYNADHQIAKATVETWLSCDLGAWIPERFEQNLDFTIRRRLAMAKHPNRSQDHPKASPIDGLFFSTRPGRHLRRDMPVPVEHIKKFINHLLQNHFTRILVLTTEQEDMEYYGTSLTDLYKECSYQIGIRRFPITPFREPPNHIGIRQAIRWLYEDSGYKLVHCGGSRGRTGLVIGCILREQGWSYTNTLRAIHRVGHIRDDGQSEFVENHD